MTCRLGVVVLLVVTVAACSFEESGEPHEGTPAVSRNGRIAFTSRDAIHVARPGRAAQRITDPGENEFDVSPEWSPNGSRIAFDRIDETVFHWSVLYVVGADGSGLRQLVEDGEQPSWSPDGKKIAFERFGLPGDVYTIDTDGTNERLLLRRADSPAWSPDGSKIAFVQGMGETIAVVDLKTKRIKRVLDATKLDSSQVGTADEPAWSPDGAQIVFSATSTSFPEIYVVNVDGTGLRRLTRNEQTDQSPTWTRDGRIIYAHSPDDGPQRLYVVNSDGSGVRRLGLAR